MPKNASPLLARRVVYDGFVRLVVATVRLDDGTRHDREVMEHSPAAAVLPYDPLRRVALLARLMRSGPLLAGADPYLLEAPAGLLDGGEDGVACIRREAMEEVGLRLGPVEPVATAWSSPGMCSESVALFLAPYAAADRVGEGGGLADEGERIEVVEMPLGTLWSLAGSGRLTDMKTLLLVQALKLRRPDLFA